MKINAAGNFLQEQKVRIACCVKKERKASCCYIGLTCLVSGVVVIVVVVVAAALVVAAIASDRPTSFSWYCGRCSRFFRHNPCRRPNRRAKGDPEAHLRSTGVLALH